MALASALALCASLAAPARAGWTGPYAVAGTLTAGASNSANIHYPQPNPVTYSNYALGSSASSADYSNNYCASYTDYLYALTVKAYWVWDGNGTSPAIGAFASYKYLMTPNVPVDYRECPEMSGPEAQKVTATGSSHGAAVVKYGVLPIGAQGIADPNGNHSPTNSPCYYFVSSPQSMRNTCTAYFVMNNPPQAGDCFAGISFSGSLTDIVYIVAASDSATGLDLTSGQTTNLTACTPDGTVQASVTWALTGDTGYVTSTQSGGAVAITRDGTAGSGQVTATASWIDGGGTTRTCTYLVGCE